MIIYPRELTIVELASIYKRAIQHPSVEPHTDCLSYKGIMFLGSSRITCYYSYDGTMHSINLRERDYE